MKRCDCPVVAVYLVCTVIVFWVAFECLDKVFIRLALAWSL